MSVKNIHKGGSLPLAPDTALRSICPRLRHDHISLRLVLRYPLYGGSAPAGIEDAPPPPEGPRPPRPPSLGILVGTLAPRADRRAGAPPTVDATCTQAAYPGAEFCAERQPFIDLQWFAKPEDEGRTEQPSEQKLRRARREEGRVPKSQELTAALGLLFPALCLVFLAPYLLETCVEMVRFFLSRATEWDPAKDRIIAGVFAQYYLKLALPFMLAGVVAGVFGHLVQSGFLFTTKPLKPDFSKIVPHFGQYFSRTIFSLNGLYNLGKSFFKMGIIGAAAYIIVSGDIEKIMNFQRTSLQLGVTTIATLVAKLLIVTAVLLLILSVPDYLFQRYQFMQQMKMSRHEVQEERKMDEGDPLVKSHIRARMRQLMSQNLREAVPRADVVITNPTHFACAIVYEPGKMEGPMLLAKGEDEMAFQIRRLATEAGVPIVENKPLARAIYAQVEIGDIIPVLYYEAIATILSKVWEINKARRRVRAEA